MLIWMNTAQACADEQQQLLAFNLLLKHSTAKRRTLKQKQGLSIAQTACQEGLRLPSVLRSAALVTATKVLICA